MSHTMKDVQDWSREMRSGWEERVRACEAEGMTRSDAQAVVDAEDAKRERKMSQHTPGPWKASEFIGEAGLEIVADGQCIARAYPLLQRDANARLIAAAPKLLAAVKEALRLTNVEDDHLERMRHERDYEQLAGVYGGRLSVIQQQLQAVLAAAEGR